MSRATSMATSTFSTDCDPDERHLLFSPNISATIQFEYDAQIAQLGSRLWFTRHRTIDQPDMPGPVIRTGFDVWISERHFSIDHHSNGLRYSSHGVVMEHYHGFQT